MTAPLRPGDLALVRCYLDALARSPDVPQVVSAHMARRLLATVDARDQDAIEMLLHTTTENR